MARTIFLVLLLLNLIALAWVYVKGDERTNAGREPQRIKAEFSAEKIRALSSPENGISTSVSDGLSQTQTALSTTASAASEICHSYTGATIKEAQQITQTISTKLPGARVVANPIVMPTVFDLVIAGLVSHPLAETRLAEVKKLGFRESLQIRADDNNRFSLLIASYPERGVAEEALKAAVKKGVASVVVVERQPAPEKATIEVRGSENALKKLPEQIALFKMLSPAACTTQ